MGEVEDRVEKYILCIYIYIYKQKNQRHSYLFFYTQSRTERKVRESKIIMISPRIQKFIDSNA
jgi:hypothetical protein